MRKRDSVLTRQQNQKTYLYRFIRKNINIRQIIFFILNLIDLLVDSLTPTGNRCIRMLVIKIYNNRQKENDKTHRKIETNRKIKTNSLKTQKYNQDTLENGNK